jgi:uncharacterized protein YutE (UPF0331/DUF86 family)
MDRQLIEEKLELLRRCVKRIEDKRPSSAEVLKADLDLQDIITANLTRAVQVCVDIAAHIIAEREVEAPDSMGKAFETLVRLKVIDSTLGERMMKAVGFRNIAIHNYQVIDWQIVHAICHKELDDFRKFAAAVSALLSNP